MFEQTLTLENVFYLLFGLVGLCGTVFALWNGAHSRSRENADERERIVRIDENLRDMRGDVADIKADMRQTKDTLAKHTERIIKLEQDQKAAWRRIDELKEADNERQTHQGPNA